MLPIETLNRWGEMWASVMLRGLIDSTALLAVVSLIWLALRRRLSPALVHGLFLLVLLKLALPIPIAVPGWLASASPRHLLDRLAARGTVGHPPTAVRQDRAVSTPDLPATAPESSGPPGSGPVSRPAAIVPAAVVARGDLALATGLMLAWAAVISALLLKLGLAQWRLHRLLARAEPIDPASLPVDPEPLREAIGVRRAVPILSSSAVASPAVWGPVRPRLIIPADMARHLTPGHWRWVLLHELAHVRRGDLWVATLQRLVQVAYFFHPAAWLAGRVLDVQREYACDDAALATCDLPRRDCGAAFLAVVERACASPGPTGPALGMSHHAKSLRNRLMRILDHRRKVSQDRGPHRYPSEKTHLSRECRIMSRISRAHAAEPGRETLSILEAGHIRLALDEGFRGVFSRVIFAILDSSEDGHFIGPFRAAFGFPPG